MLADQEIIDAVLSGDQARFSELHERYGQRLLGLLWHACGNIQLAEDLGQEAFFRAFRKLHLYSGKSQFYTWLARIALNLLHSYRRRRSVESELDREGIEVVADSVGQRNDPDAPILLTETQQLVRSAIAMLDAERREVLLLRDFEEMNYEAIAQVLDLPIGTVRSRLHRARIELKMIVQSQAAQLGIAEP